MCITPGGWYWAGELATTSGSLGDQDIYKRWRASQVPSTFLLEFRNMSTRVMSHDSKDHIFRFASLSHFVMASKGLLASRRARERGLPITSPTGSSSTCWTGSCLSRLVSPPIVFIYIWGFNIPVGMELGSCQLQRRRYPIWGQGFYSPKITLLLYGVSWDPLPIYLTL